MYFISDVISCRYLFVGLIHHDSSLAPESKAALVDGVYVKSSAAFPDNDSSLIVVLRFIRFPFPDLPEPIQFGYAN